MTEPELTQIPVFGTLKARLDGDDLWLTPSGGESSAMRESFAIKMHAIDPADIRQKAAAIAEQYAHMSRLAGAHLARAQSVDAFRDYIEEVFPFAVTQGVIQPDDDPLEALCVVNVFVEVATETIWVIDFAYSHDFETGARDNVLVIRMHDDGQLIEVVNEG